MRLATEPSLVRDLFCQCAQRGVSMLAPCLESTAEIEGILNAAQRFAQQHGIRRLPVCVGFTGTYRDNPQLCKIDPDAQLNNNGNEARGDAGAGFDLIMALLAAYASLGDRWERVVFLPYLDHGQPPRKDGNDDRAILYNDARLDRLAVVMFDASADAFDENARRTAEYVERVREHVLVEGAVDRIYEPEEARNLHVTREDTLTKPETARRFKELTGADLIVPNVGTEHRVTAGEEYVTHYDADRAAAVRDVCGPCMVLHGTSCLGRDLARVPGDGFVKVNLYTRMAVEGGIRLLEEMERARHVLVEQRNLAANSPTWRAWLYREHVDEVITDTLGLLGYARLAEE